MKVTETKLPGVIHVEPRIFPDSRGYFFELSNRKRFEEAGLPGQWLQDNVSSSVKGVLRGLHFQNPTPQGKLVSVLSGEIFDVAVDIRKGSPHFGKWVGVTLTGKQHNQLYIPEGFAHGFIVLSDKATVMYKTTDYWAPQAERTLLWNDPEIGIEWPTKEALVSDKDAKGLTLSQMQEYLPTY